MRSLALQRGIVLLIALAMQVCCCRVHALLLGEDCGGCATKVGAKAAQTDRPHCCCQSESDEDCESTPTEPQPPTGCLCALAAVKAPAIDTDVSVPAPDLIAVLPFEMAILEAVADAPAQQRWWRGPPERPGGRIAIDRWGHRLI